MNKMNVKSDRQPANTYASDVHGKDHCMKVKYFRTKQSSHHQFNWFNPLGTATEHETICSHPKKSGAEVMLALQATDATQSEDKKLFNTLIELLSYEKIIFNGMKNQNLFFSSQQIWTFPFFHRSTNETIPYGRVRSQIVLWNVSLFCIQSSMGGEGTHQ